MNREDVHKRLSATVEVSTCSCPSSQDSFADFADAIYITAVTSLQLSDDMIVSGSDDGEVRVWNFGPGVNGATAQVGGGNATASTSTSSR